MRLDLNQQCLSGGRFTVSWGYQFSYTSKYQLRDAREFYGSFKNTLRSDSPYKNGTPYGNRTHLTRVKGEFPKPIEERCIRID